MEYTHQAAATAGSDWWNAEATTPAAARARESLRHTVRRTSVAAAPLYVIGIKPLMAHGFSGFLAVLALKLSDGPE